MPRAKQKVSQLVVGGLAVKVTRKSIKNMHLRVRPDAAGNMQVEVSAPRLMPDAVISAFVASKRAWIDRQMADQAQRPMVRAAGASKAEVEQWRACIKACVPPLVEHWAPRMGIDPARLTLAYRNMTSRWGSCQPATGRICINIRLALYPPECLEYVVVHELCHLHERGHGPRFKALMTRYLPDWPARKAKLKG